MTKFYTMGVLLCAALAFALFDATAGKAVRHLSDAESNNIILDLNFPSQKHDLKRVPHEHYCRFFYLMREDEQTLMECPEEQFFDAVTLTCVEKSKAQCWGDKYNGKFKVPLTGHLLSKPKIDFKCPFPWGEFPDKDDCSKFFLCLNSKPQHKKCQHSEKFDVVERKCLNEKDAKCVGENDEVEKDFKCPHTWGSFPHSKDCSKYHLCLSKKPSVKSCKNGELFDDKKNECKAREKVDCGSRNDPYATTTSVEITTTKATTTVKEITTTEVPTTSVEVRTSTATDEQEGTASRDVSSDETSSTSVDLSTSESTLTTTEDDSTKDISTTSEDLVTSDSRESTSEKDSSTEPPITSEESVSSDSTSSVSEEDVTVDLSTTSDEVVTSDSSESVSQDDSTTEAPTTADDADTSDSNESVSPDDFSTEPPTTSDGSDSSDSNESVSPDDSSTEPPTTSDDAITSDSASSASEEDFTGEPSATPDVVVTSDSSDQSTTPDDTVTSDSDTSDDNSSTEPPTTSDDTVTTDSGSSSTEDDNSNTEPPTSSEENVTNDGTSTASDKDTTTEPSATSDSDVSPESKSPATQDDSSNETETETEIIVTSDGTTEAEISSEESSTTVDDTTIFSTTEDEIKSTDDEDSQTSASPSVEDGTTVSQTTEDITTIPDDVSSTDKDDDASPTNMQETTADETTSESVKPTFSTTQPKGFQCPSKKGNFAHETYCNIYYSCRASAFEVKACREGTLFDTTVASCNNANDVDCGDRVMLPNDETTAEDQSTAAPDTEPSTEMPEESSSEDADVVTSWRSSVPFNLDDYECPEAMGIFPHPTDPNAFIQCDNFTPHNHSCPKGLLYDPTVKVCVWPKFAPS